jgi:hypothetical protein
MAAAHFLMKSLRNVATEMALHVLAYNLTRVMNIVGIKPLIAAIVDDPCAALSRSQDPKPSAPGQAGKGQEVQVCYGVRSSQPPRPRVMRGLPARPNLKRSQGRPRAGYRAAKRVEFRGADLVR